MSGAAKVNFNVQNLTDTVVTATNGVNFVQGQSVRGPWGEPSEIFNSWPAFVRTYGGLDPNLETPKLVKRILEKGGSVRFSRVGHYTDIDDRGTLTAVKATQVNNTKITIVGISSATAAFKVVVKVGGVEVNSINITPTNSLEDNLNNIATAIENLNAGIATYSITNAGADTGVVTLSLINPQTTVELQDVTGFTQTPSTATIELPFEIALKNAGLDGNNLTVTISAGSNGQTSSYNLTVAHKVDKTLVENYTNIIIPNAAYVDPNFNDNTYLKEITNNSKLIDVTYKDLLGQAPINYSSPVMLTYTGGTNGTAPTAADYIGSSNSNLGLYAFDNYDDSYYLVSFDMDDESLEVAGGNYAAIRQDLFYLIWLTGKTKDALITERSATMIDNKHVIFVGDGLLIKDLSTSNVDLVNPLGDVLASANRSDREFGPWYSFAGPNRGIITDVLGVGTNFGTPAKAKDLDELANRGINVVLNKNNSIKLWGNFTGQLSSDQERFINITKLVIYLKKSLRPTLEGFLEEPNDLATWKRIYYVVKPFLDSLVTNRALYSYQWLGDQDAKSMNDLAINNPTDVQNGKYRVRLNIKAINSIQDITVDIVLTPTGLDFELVTNLI